MKTIIQVFTHKCINMPQDDVNNFWGLGDMIRGTINLYYYCKKNGYKFIVDTQLHTLSKYLINYQHEYSNLILNNKNNIYFIHGSDIDNYIKNSNNEILYFFTNFNKSIENIDEECMLFMNKLLELNDYYKEYVNNILLNYSNYNIIQFRLGDNDIVRNNNNLDYDFYMKKLLRTEFNKNDIFISDSLEFKKYLKNNNIEITILDTIPKHIGLENDITDTIIEIYLLKKCNKIKTCSFHGGVNGFIQYLTLIFNKKYELI